MSRDRKLPKSIKTALAQEMWDGLQRYTSIKEQGKEVLWLDELRQPLEHMAGGLQRVFYYSLI